MSNADMNVQLRSLVTKSGDLELSLMQVPLADPAADEVIVRLEASPLKPSDLGLLVGPADIKTANQSGTAASPVITAKIPDNLMRMVASRLDQSMPVGNEGAGVVVKAGASKEAQALM